MACYLAGHAIFTAKYVKKYSTYKLAKFEWLKDLLAMSKNARALVCLLFLVRKDDKAKFNIPSIFHAPDTLVYNKPHKYQELEYRIHTIELRMEFYLHLFELFYHPRDTMYNVFNDTKILIARLVMIPSTLFKSFLKINFHATVAHGFRSTRPKFLCKSAHFELIEFFTSVSIIKSALFLYQMSNLDVYCVSYYDNKHVFADIGEFDNFATNGYAVDEV